MKQLSKHELNKLPVKELRKIIPVQITSDGEVFAVIFPAKEARQIQLPKTKEKLAELPLSKHRQAQNRLPRNF